MVKVYSIYNAFSLFLNVEYDASKIEDFIIISIDSIVIDDSIKYGIKKSDF